MIIRFLAILSLVLLIGCSNEDNNKPPVQSTLTPFVWTSLYSTGVPSRWPNDINGFPYIDIPSCNTGSIHYVVTPLPSKIAQNQIITISFALSGDGVLIPTEGLADYPYADIHLFLWRRGDDLSSKYEFYRWWSNPGAVHLKSPAEFTLSVKVATDQWSSVFGKKANADPDATAGFAATLNDLYAVGFTFGGMFFGHGVCSQISTIRFILKNYKVD